MLDPIISPILAAWPPIISELFLCVAAPYSMKTHFHCFCALWLHIVSYDRMSSCIFSLHWGPELAVSHFIEALSGWDSFACIDIHGPNLCFLCQGHDCFHDLCYVEHSSIFGGERDILGHEKMSTSLASCLVFAAVRGVAVDCQNHVGLFIGRYGLFL